MIAIPVLIPVTVPAASTVAIAVLLLHVPPSAVSDKCVVCPMHTVGVPVMTVAGFTITGTKVKHPEVPNV